RGRRASFTAQPFTLRCIAREVRSEGLQGDGAREPIVRREIDTAHPATPDFADDRVRTDDPTWLEACLVVAFIEQIGNPRSYRGVQERSGARMVFEQREDLGADGAVAGGLAVDPASGFLGRAVDRALEEFSNAAPLVGGHPRCSLSSRKSHARARLQRRFKVAGDMPRAAAASSIASPAKYRSSTIFACSASICSSRSSASSRAGSIASSDAAWTSDAVSDTRSRPAQRFCAPLARARSTRIWRTDRAAIPTKCRSSCHGVPGPPASLKYAS